MYEIDIIIILNILLVVLMVKKSNMSEANMSEASTKDWNFITVHQALCCIFRRLKKGSQRRNETHDAIIFIFQEIQKTTKRQHKAR